MDGRLADFQSHAHPLIRDRERWRLRSRAAEPWLKEAWRRGLVPTPYFVEARAYYFRAKALQEMNLGLRRRAPVGDRLQESIPIYDTVRRRYAGFSNVLEQLWYGPKAPKYGANVVRGLAPPLLPCSETMSPYSWAYLCLVHRVTGSGASFMHDHGWRNTVVPTMAGLPPADWPSFLLEHPGPIFTSIGNQIPPFNRRTNPAARNGGQQYLADVAPRLVDKVIGWFNWRLCEKFPMPVPITSAVDFALRAQQELGCRRFVFVLTAWVMDLAEYLPHLVDPASACYHGKNAQESLEVCFNRQLFKGGRQRFYDAGTQLFADLTGTHPMDVEDASPGCDLIRWLENYVPRQGFDHIVAQNIMNSSSLMYSKGRQP